MNRFPAPTKLITEPSKLTVRISSFYESACTEQLGDFKIAFMSVGTKQSNEFSCYDSKLGSPAMATVERHIIISIQRLTISTIVNIVISNIYEKVLKR